MGMEKVVAELTYYTLDPRHPVEIRAMAGALEYLVRREWVREQAEGKSVDVECENPKSS